MVKSKNEIRQDYLESFVGGDKSLIPSALLNENILTVKNEREEVEKQK